MDSRASATSQALRRFYVAVSSTDSKLGTLLELLRALQQDDGDSRQQAGSQATRQHTKSSAEFGRSRRLAAVICCSSRDSLDAVAAALLEAHVFSVIVMHSDMTDKERETQLALLKAEAAGKLASDPSLLRPSEGAGEATPGSAPQSGLSNRADSHERSVASSSVTFELREGSASQRLRKEHDVSHTDGMAVVLVTTDVCLKPIPKELLPLGVPLLVQYDLPRQKDVYSRRISSVFGGGKERRSTAGRNIVIDFVVAGEVAAFRASEAWFAGVIREMPVHVADIF